MNIGLKQNLPTLWVLVFAIAVGGCLRAQNIIGNWQGSITPPNGKPLRMILQVTHDDGGAFKARIYSIDQDFTGDWVDSFTAITVVFPTPPLPAIGKTTRFGLSSSEPFNPRSSPRKHSA